jgi:cobyrinic acid a,c-diamide synthase
MVAAPASGQGKTSFTAALARLHRRAGRRVAVFKIGPDFLDPLLLEAACGAPVQQLDLWMCGEADVRARLHAAASCHDLILVEGMMGLFDGTPSAANLAQHFGLPVLAVIDANALAQSFGAIALGLARYRLDLELAGVAANRVASDWHAKLLRESLPAGIRWFGHLREHAEARLPERHLGLVPAAEQADIEARIEALADALAESLGKTPELPAEVEFEATAPAVIHPWLAGLRIAVARDAAFCFLYPANLQLLREAGAELQFFSPLAGEVLPDCDAVWLPGGYPELHLHTLAARADLFASLRAHVEADRPLLAECGGFLVLLEALALGESEPQPMAGLIKGRARVGARLAGLGMQRVELPEGALRGHSFHHAHADLSEAPLTLACDPSGSPTAEAVYRRRRLTAGFMHFYFPSNPQAACGLFRP